MVRRVFVSGADGFIGAAVARHLRAAGIAVVKGRRAATVTEAEAVAYGDLRAPTADWDAGLVGCDGFVHAAGLAHRRGTGAAEAMAVNRDGAARLARAARLAGVARFVLISSAGVHGRALAAPISETSPIAPPDDYAASKSAGEAAVAAELSGSATALAVVRQTAVIGPGCPGNLNLLMRAIQAGVPLPLGAIRNRRSFVTIGPLCALIALCLSEPAAEGETFLAADAAPIATPDVVRALAEGLGRPTRLVPLVPSLLAGIGRALGREAMMQSLIGDFVVDAARARTHLGWVPAADSLEGLRATACAWVRQRNGRNTGAGPASSPGAAGGGAAASSTGAAR